MRNTLQFLSHEVHLVLNSRQEDLTLIVEELKAPREKDVIGAPPSVVFTIICKEAMLWVTSNIKKKKKQKRKEKKDEIPLHSQLLSAQTITIIMKTFFDKTGERL